MLSYERTNDIEIYFGIIIHHTQRSKDEGKVVKQIWFNKVNVNVKSYWP